MRAAEESRSRLGTRKGIDERRHAALARVARGRRSSQRRGHQEKLNVLAEALAALMLSRASEDPELLEDAEKLRDCVGMEKRH